MESKTYPQHIVLFLLRVSIEKLIKVASNEIIPYDAFNALLHVEIGNGWKTEGMLSGFGYNIYCSTPERFQQMTTECRAIITACLENTGAQ